jgi:hypothetical protein
MMICVHGALIRFDIAVYSTEKVCANPLLNSTEMKSRREGGGQAGSSSESPLSRTPLLSHLLYPTVIGPGFLASPILMYYLPSRVTTELSESDDRERYPTYIR